MSNNSDLDPNYLAETFLLSDGFRFIKSDLLSFYLFRNKFNFNLKQWVMGIAHLNLTVDSHTPPTPPPVRG